MTGGDLEGCVVGVGGVLGIHYLGISFFTFYRKHHLGSIIEEKAKTSGGEPAELGFKPDEEVGIITLDREGRFLLRKAIIND